jgi:hypothetical protein
MSKRKRKKKERALPQRAPSLLQEKCGVYYHYIVWGLVVAVIIFIAAIRIRLLSIPLERDEGEFAYMGQLMLQGIPPYALAANMKLPGTYAAYALIMALFGQTIEAIHLGLLLVNVSTMLMVFFLTRRLFDDYAGVVACAAYGVLSLSPGVYGTSAHATHFVLLPALGGIVLLLKALGNDNPVTFFLSGFLLGISYLMKQPGIFFGIFALLYLIGVKTWKVRAPARPLLIQCLLFISGLSMPYLLTCLALYALGVFERFWFWTVLYAFQYASLQSLAEGIALFLPKLSIIVDGFYLLWILAGTGLFILLWEKRVRAPAPFMCGFFFFSCLAVCPGLYFRQHYFVLVLPAIAIFTGVAVRYCHTRCAHLKNAWFIPPLLFLICFFHGVFLKRVFFFTGSPVTACRYMYFPNPFPESLAVADYIRNHSEPASTIAVLGSEPQIYFYARRRSATSYLYMYSLMEKHRYARTMQQEMIKEIERSRPEYIIYAKIPFSWLRREESEMLLLQWFETYRRNYTITGIAEIVSPRETKYLWDDQAKNYRPQTNAIYVLRRNSA